MTPADAPRFAELLAGLGEVFNEPVSEIRARLYFEALADLDLAAVEAAVAGLIRTATFFPKPAEIREVIDGSPEDRAVLAWATFEETARRHGQYVTVEFADRMLGATLLAMFGGWPEAVTEFGEASEPEWIARRKEFLALYRAGAPRRPPPPSVILPGIHEINNRARGFLAEADRWRHERRLIGGQPDVPRLTAATGPDVEVEPCARLSTT